MTPGARVQAAIEILDRIAGGDAAEAALTGWARASRFAGSKDRAAVRDHVFSALRRRRAAAAFGGGSDGRALMLGLLALDGDDPAVLFTGEGHAPAPLSQAERGRLAEPPELDEGARLNLPDWLIPLMRESLGADLEAVAAALCDRAPVFLRVNTARTTPEAAIARLAGLGIEAVAHAASPSALLVRGNPRGIRNLDLFTEGLVELQDLASQAVVDALPIRPGTRALDYCAGGGGKALAMAARGAEVVATDADFARMADIGPRAARAGVPIRTARQEELAGQIFDLVLCDAPCSGSGAWRRQPEAKWRLTPQRLAELSVLQGDILSAASVLVAPGGILAYATCSVLRVENEDRVAAFLASSPGWSHVAQRRFSPLAGADGFFLAMFRRGPGAAATN